MYASLVSQRINQAQPSKNRHLLDVREMPSLPQCQTMGDVLIVTPAELIALKVIGMAGRPNTPEGLTDQADLFRLLLRFPDLKAVASEVQTALEQFNASPDAHQTWKQLVEQEIITDDDDAY